MDKGYILANKYRRAIFDELVAGNGNPQRIAKKQRIIPTIVTRIITDFETADIITQQHGRYIFTEKGERLKEQM